MPLIKERRLGVRSFGFRVKALGLLLGGLGFTV